MAALLGVLGGCSSSGYYVDVPEPVEPARVEQDGDTATEWVVKPGDTLYAIAFSAGMDWKDVASANGIGAPYTIYPGQRLRLSRAPAPAESAEGAEGDAPAAAEAHTQPAPDVGPPLVVQQPTPMPAPPPPASRQPAPTVAVVTPPPPAAAAPTRAVRNGAWQWPAGGKLTRGFSTGAQPHKGVDLAGRIGDPVYAANGGTVVYAGSGVRGYGNLLIVKHDAQHLSAYAHNSRLLVKEGEVVDGGQKIAEIGDSGTDRVKLHFEIRRQGNPVDPLKVLPRR